MATYNQTSPYYNTQIVNNYLDVIDFREIPSEDDDYLFQITSTYENRPDLLANDLYNDSNLWWVFAVRNRSVLKDPVYDFTPGQLIYLPKISTLKRILGI